MTESGREAHGGSSRVGTGTLTDVAIPLGAIPGRSAGGGTVGGDARALRDPWLWAALALAVAVRLWYTLLPLVALGDQSCYAWLGQNLFAGKGYTYYNGTTEAHFSPLFPIILGALSSILGNGELALKGSYLIFGSLLTIPVYRLARDMHGPRTGRLAAALIAVLPALVVGSLLQTLSEPPFLFFLATGLSFLYRATCGGSAGHFAVAGSCFSLAYLVRPEGFLFFLIAIAYALFSALWRRDLPPRQVAVRLGAMLGAFFILALPWVIHIRSVTGHWGLTAKNVTTYVTTRGLVHKDGRAFQRDTWGLVGPCGEVRYFDRHSDKGLLAILRREPYKGRVWSDVKKNLTTLHYSVVNRRVFGRALLTLAILGLVAVAWDRRRIQAESLCALVVAYLASFLIFFVNDRFIFPALIPGAIWAGRGAEHILRWIEGTEFPGLLGRTPARRLLQAAGLILLGASLLAYGRREYAEKTAFHQEVLAAGAWLREHTPRDSIIMAAGPELAFAAGHAWLPAPVASLEDLVCYGRARRASYLVFRGYYLFLRDDQRRDLFDGAADTADLELLVKRGDIVIEDEKLVSTNAFVVYRLKEQ